MTRLGPFLLEASLGRGASGEVWRAISAEGAFPGAVAVKRIQDAGSHSLAEVRAAARLDHPRIVRLLDVGRDGDDVWIAMDLCSGGTARTATPRTWNGARALLVDLLDALSHAHAHGIVHRDVKPSNLLLAAPTDASPGWRLGDLGVAWMLEATGAPRAAGTLWYMAPEQVVGRWCDYGPWTDLYGVGCLVHVLLTGRPPFSGPDAARRHLHDRPPPLASETAPPGLADWVAHLLEKDPRARPPSAAHARAALLALEGADVLLNAPDLPDGLAADDDATLEEHALDPVVLGRVAPRPCAPPPLPLQPPDHRSELAPAPSTGAAAVPFRVPRLVGQRGAREALWAALRASVDEGRARGVLISGLPGAGASRLAHWLCVAAHEAAGAWTASPRPDAHGSRALAEVVRSALGMEGVDPLEGIDRIRSRLGAGPRVAERVWRWLCGDEPGDALWRHEVVERAIRSAARGAPVVLFLDDFDEAALDLARAALPAVVLSTGRSGDPTPRGWSQVVVPPLSEDEIARLVAGHLGVAPDLAGSVAGRSHGLPGVALAELRALLEGGHLAPSPVGYRLAGVPRVDPAGDAVVDALPDPVAQDLELAAVLGLAFDRRLWEAAGARDPDVAAEPLARADRLVADGPGWRFTSRRVREALIDRARRRGALQDHHLAAARALAEVRPWDRGALGMHLLEAGRAEEAAPVLLDAADALMLQGFPRSAMPLLFAHQEAVERAGGSEAQRLRARGRIALGHLRTGHARQAEEEARRVLDQARALGDPRCVARAELDLAVALRQRGALSEALGAFEEALPALVDDDGSVARARIAYISALRLAGRPERAEQEAHALLAILPPDDARALSNRAWAGLQLAAACGAQGRWSEQEAHARQALEGFRQLGFRSGEAQALNALAEGARHQGDLDEAEAGYQAAIALLEAGGLASALVSRLNLGLVQLLRGEDDDAAVTFGAVAREASRAHRLVYGGAAALGLATVAARSGDPQGYRAHRAEAEGLLGGTGFAEPDLVLLRDLADEAARALPAD